MKKLWILCFIIGGLITLALHFGIRMLFNIEDWGFIDLVLMFATPLVVGFIAWKIAEAYFKKKGLM